MQLFFTPRSHFSRKVRLLLAGLNIDVELIHVGDPASTDAAVFGGNPLLSVPMLKDGDASVFDSDGICEYLVRRYDPSDSFGVLRHDLDALNARAVMNGIMAAHVELVLAARSGLAVTYQPRLAKKRELIRNCLEWLDDNANLFSAMPDFLSFHLISLWDHLALFNFVPLNSFNSLVAHIEHLNTFTFIVDSQPKPLATEKLQPETKPVVPVAIAAVDAPTNAVSSALPAQFVDRFKGRQKRRLGDVFGLKNFGVNIVKLAPGALSSLRHSHAAQDEFVYVLEGALKLTTNSAVEQLAAGMCAGFKSGTGDAHHFLNNTHSDAWYLEVGDRSLDEVSYPDDDLKGVFVNGAWHFTHKNGQPF